MHTANLLTIGRVYDLEVLDRGLGDAAVEIELVLASQARRRQTAQHLRTPGHDGRVVVCIAGLSNGYGACGKLHDNLARPRPSLRREQLVGWVPKQKEEGQIKWYPPHGQESEHT